MKIVFQIFVVLALLAFTAETSKLCLKKENTSCKVDDTDDDEEEPTEDNSDEKDDFKLLTSAILPTLTTSPQAKKSQEWMGDNTLEIQEDSFQSLTLNPPENC